MFIRRPCWRQRSLATTTASSFCRWQTQQKQNMGHLGKCVCHAESDSVVSWGRKACYWFHGRNNRREGSGRDWSNHIGGLCGNLTLEPEGQKALRPPEMLWHEDSHTRYSYMESQIRRIIPLENLVIKTGRDKEATDSRNRSLNLTLQGPPWIWWWISVLILYVTQQVMDHHLLLM